MIEFEVDMSAVADELDTVILHDECCERESVEYVRKTERDRLLAENERLKRENEELRDKLETYGVCSGGIITLFASGIKEQEAENAKLRELVRTIWLAGDFRAFLGVGELEVRMRELGIEVDG